MENLMHFGLNLGTFGVMGAGLAFGWAYDWAVGTAELDGYIDGYRGIAVVVGTLVTVLASAVFIGLPNALIVLAMFSMTGLKMVAGDIQRAIGRRKAERQSLMTALLLGIEATDDNA